MNGTSARLRSAGSRVRCCSSCLLAAATGCTGSGHPDDTRPPRQGRPTATRAPRHAAPPAVPLQVVVTRVSGRLAPARRRGPRRRAVGRTIAGVRRRGVPRRSTTRARTSATCGRRSPRGRPGTRGATEALLTNRSLGPTTESVHADQAYGVPLGARAAQGRRRGDRRGRPGRSWSTAGRPRRQRVTLAGRLLLTRDRTRRWRIFGYDVRRSVTPAREAPVSRPVRARLDRAAPRRRARRGAGPRRGGDAAVGGPARRGVRWCGCTPPGPWTTRRGVVWVLCLGLGRPARPAGCVGQRADAIQLVGLNLRTGAGTMIGDPAGLLRRRSAGTAATRSTPRCTYGGPQLMARLGGRLVGVRPDYVFTTGFLGFRGDGPGDRRGHRELEVRVLRPGPAAGLHAGPNNLNPFQALIFGRVRHPLPRGDFDRSGQPAGAAAEHPAQGAGAPVGQPGFMERGPAGGGRRTWTPTCARPSSTGSPRRSPAIRPGQAARAA